MIQHIKRYIQSVHISFPVIFLLSKSYDKSAPILASVQSRLQKQTVSDVKYTTKFHFLFLNFWILSNMANAMYAVDTWKTKVLIYELHIKVL